MHPARIVRGDVLAVKVRSSSWLPKAAAWGISHRSAAYSAECAQFHHGFGHTRIASAIITESALSFLGLGFPSDFPTWGRLLFDGANFLQITPSRVIWPGLAISLTVLSVNYVGDAIRDALDPRTQTH